MAGIGDAFQDDILELVFLATAIANIADNAAASPETNIHNALHTADPEAGTLSTSEVTYTSYARVNVARSGSGWTAASGGSISPQANIDFPAGTGGSGTVTHWGTGKTGGGAALLYWCGTVTPNIVTGDGITPRLTTSSTITLD